MRAGVCVRGCMGAGGCVCARVYGCGRVCVCAGVWLRACVCARGCMGAGGCVCARVYGCGRVSLGRLHLSPQGEDDTSLPIFHADWDAPQHARLGSDGIAASLTGPDHRTGEENLGILHVVERLRNRFYRQPWKRGTGGWAAKRGQGGGGEKGGGGSEMGGGDEGKREGTTG